MARCSVQGPPGAVLCSRAWEGRLIRPTNPPILCVPSLSDAMMRAPAKVFHQILCSFHPEKTKQNIFGQRCIVMLSGVDLRTKIPGLTWFPSSHPSWLYLEPTATHTWSSPTPRLWAAQLSSGGVSHLEILTRQHFNMHIHLLFTTSFRLRISEP